MTRDTARRIAGFYVFILVFTAFPAAQQHDVASETTRLIEKLGVGPSSSVADVGAGAASDTVVQELEAAGFRIVEVLARWTGGTFLVLAERAS